MKTVWHKKEIAKTIALELGAVFIACIGSYIFQPPKLLAVLIGGVVGIGAMMVASAIWDLYHFE